MIKRVHYESKSENQNEDFEQKFWGDYVDSNNSDEQKYSSGEEEVMRKMETSHNSVEKKLKIEANKNNTKKNKKNVSVLDYVKKN